VCDPIGTGTIAARTGFAIIQRTLIVQFGDTLHIIHNEKHHGEKEQCKTIHIGAQIVIASGQIKIHGSKKSPNKHTSGAKKNQQQQQFFNKKK
jgi:hypothetical protein